MAVDWVFAAEVGAAGMALTFIALSCLAVALWLAELALRRIGTRKDMTEEKKEVS
jgi:Na+-transporting methylmalonyl-CoA/oxaloacetate decarboxylase gamma subunit